MNRRNHRFVISGRKTFTAEITTKYRLADFIETHLFALGLTTGKNFEK